MTQIIDQDGRATVASAEAETALSAGDTARAQDGFFRAGEILEREMRDAKDEQTEHLLRFLAATQFYKGGHYQKALELAEKIKAAKLPAGTQRLLPKFKQDAKGRASAAYDARVKDQLQALWTARDYAGIIALLQEHPYILPPADLAFLRAVSCEELGKYRAAVLFFADAAHRSQNNPKVMAALAPLPLDLADQGRLQQAWEYCQAQLELFPNAVTHAVASLVRYRQARQAEGDTRTAMMKEQAQYFHRAREQYAVLSAAHRNHPVIRDVMAMGYETAACALYLWADDGTIRELCKAAIAFDPTSPIAWTILGMVASGRGDALSTNGEAATAFRKAAELGDETYFPYYYLAYQAVTQSEFREALDWSRKALERGERQQAEIKSVLYQWAGISLSQLGGPREEVGEFFKKAVEVAPDNEYARKNYRHFRMSGSPELPPFIPSKPEDPQRSRFHPDRNASGAGDKLAALAG